MCLSSRQAGHIELAERLVECQYELTDRLAFYLCGRRPGNVVLGVKVNLGNNVVAFTHLLTSSFPRSQEWPLYHPSNGRQVWTMTLLFCF